MTSVSPVKTGAQVIADARIAHNVKNAFCVPGESYLEILNAFYDVNLISTRTTLDAIRGTGVTS